MRDQRVLRTLRLALITSPDDQTACPSPGPRGRGPGGKQRRLRPPERQDCML